MYQINVVYQNQSMQGQMDMRLLFFGKQACPPSHFWGPGLRDSYILHYVHSGEGVYRIGDQTFPLTAGQGFMIFPDTLVHYMADEANPWTYSWIGFTGLYAKSLMQRTQITLSKPFFSTNANSGFERFYDELLSAHHEKGGDLMIQSILYHLMAELVQCSPEAPELSNYKDAYVQKAIKFVESSYSQKISILDIASSVGLDRTYLSSLFKKQFGVSLQTFLLEYRINRAVELLANKELSVSDISRSVGYTDPFLFSKMFKKVTGYSPKKYR